MGANKQKRAVSVPSVTINTTEIRVAELTLTNAQIKALRAAPKTLAPAPGAGKMNVFIAATLMLKAGANALTETADNAAVKYKDGTGVQVSNDIEMTGFIDQTADTMTSVTPKTDAIAAKTACENQPLVLHNIGDGEWGGNAAADAKLAVRMFYRVVKISW